MWLLLLLLLQGCLKIAVKLTSALLDDCSTALGDCIVSVVFFLNKQLQVKYVWMHYELHANAYVIPFVSTAEYTTENSSNDYQWDEYT